MCGRASRPNFWAEMIWICCDSLGPLLVHAHCRTHRPENVHCILVLVIVFHQRSVIALPFFRHIPAAEPRWKRIAICLTHFHHDVLPSVTCVFTCMLCFYFPAHQIGLQSSDPGEHSIAFCFIATSLFTHAMLRIPS